MGPGKDTLLAIDRPWLRCQCYQILKLPFYGKCAVMKCLIQRNIHQTDQAKTVFVLLLVKCKLDIYCCAQRVLSYSLETAILLII